MMASLLRAFKFMREKIEGGLTDHSAARILAAKGRPIMKIDEIRANVPEGLTEAEAFFYRNAGFSHGPEGPQVGLLRCAKELARAEAWAEEVAVEFIWEDDDAPAEAYDEETDTYKEYPAVVCLAKLHGEIVASRGGIIESDNHKQAQDYRRVVEAELAEEGRDYLPQLAQSYDSKANLFRSDYERY